MDSQPSVVVESDHELVMVPGEVIRRRGSILKNPNAPVSDCSVLLILRELLLTLWVKPHCVAIQLKAVMQYFHVVLFIMLYEMVLT